MTGRSLAVLPLLFLGGILACRRQPPENAARKEEAVEKAKTYEVSKAGKLVLTVKDAPGPLVSTASPSPGEDLVWHPFLSATAHSAQEEDVLGRLLGHASDTNGFLTLLRENGYQVKERPPR